MSCSEPRNYREVSTQPHAVAVLPFKEDPLEPTRDGASQSHPRSNGEEKPFLLPEIKLYRDITFVLNGTILQGNQ